MDFIIHGADSPNGKQGPGEAHNPTNDGRHMARIPERSERVEGEPEHVFEVVRRRPVMVVISRVSRSPRLFVCRLAFTMT